MATSIQLRAINRNNVYRTILKEKKASKQKLANDLNLSIPTVTQALQDLSAKGLITMEGVFESTGGRKAQIISAREDARVALGLDITRHHVNLVMMDLGMNILGHVRKHLPFEMSQQYFEELRQMIIRISDGYEDRVLGMTISSPAIVNDDGKKIIYAPLLNQARDLYDQLLPYIPYPFHLINDASAGAYSELSSGHFRRNFLYLMLSNSVGGAIIMNGKIVEGESFRSGEFGHMTLFPEGRTCYCGKKGCVDTYCSALCLSDNLETFFEDLKNGDETCRKKWKEYLYHLSITIHNLEIGTNLEIVLGGYVGWFLKPYLSDLEELVQERSNFPDRITLSLGTFDTEASAIGDALIYLNRFIENV